jgi:hypothetical protein
VTWRCLQPAAGVFINLALKRSRAELSTDRDQRWASDLDNVHAAHIESKAAQGELYSPPAPNFFPGATVPVTAINSANRGCQTTEADNAAAGSRKRTRQPAPAPCSDVHPLVELSQATGIHVEWSRAELSMLNR